MYLMKLKTNALRGVHVCLLLPSVYLSVCDIVSAIKQSVGFSRNLVQELFTESCSTRVTFVKIGSVTATLYSRV